MSFSSKAVDVFDVVLISVSDLDFRLNTNPDLDPGF
jgi:hypothetical protein